MTPLEYRAALTVVGMTEGTARELFGIDEPTSRRWETGEQHIPRGVALSLWLMAAYGVSTNEAQTLSKSPRLIT